MISNKYKDVKKLWRRLTVEESKGILIVIEGFDGTGKTTQINLLNKRLINKGYNTLITKQPTDNFRSDPIVKDYLKNGSKYTNAIKIAQKASIDRLNHVNSTISNALSLGKIVICDRYVYSSIALFDFRNVPISEIIELNRGIIKPNIAFFLDLDAFHIMKRIKDRDGISKKWEEKNIHYIESICNNYKKFGEEMIIMQANKNIESINNDIINHLERKVHGIQ